MSHLCTTATFRTIYHKRKILDIRLNIKDSRLVGVTRFELATTRPPDVYSNRAELHPASEKQCKCRIKKSVFKILSGLFLLSGHFPCFRKPGNACITGEKSLSERQARVARLGLNPLRNVTGRRSTGRSRQTETMQRPDTEQKSAISNGPAHIRATGR